MKIRVKYHLLLSLLIMVYFVFSYYVFNGWWYSSIGSLLIISIAYLIWNKDFLRQTGLLLDLPILARSLILAVITTILSLLIMKYIASRNYIHIEYTNWRDYYHDVFYILNEEIVLGAICLFTMINDLKIKAFTTSLLLAVFFAIIHYIFYRWIFLDSGILGLTSLITLFLVGFVRNSLIVITGHIGYSWALHFGWMSIMFGSMHTDGISALDLTETERFNLYLGSTEMLIISIIIAIIFLAFWKIKSKN